MALSLAFVVWHAMSVDLYLDRISDLDLASGPAGEAGFNGRDLTLGVAADGQTWVRLTLERMEGEAARQRWTDTDNALDGREVHWSSWWGWWLELCGRLRGTFTEEDLVSAVEKASRWANLPLWGMALLVGTGLAVRHWGWWAGATFAALIVGNRGFYTALHPGYPDHHGVVAMLALGMVAGAAGMSWSVSKVDEVGPSVATKLGRARRFAVFSALCGALGLALSASSLVVLIALCGLGGGVAFLCFGKRPQAEAARAAPEVWILWGRVGGAASALLYFLEYGPNDFGWRLEVNHPAFAVAWWGGAEVVGWALRLGLGGKSGPQHYRAVLGLVGVLLPPILVLIGGAAFFAPLDPFLAGVHRHIDEFKPIWTQSGRLQGLFWLALIIPVLAVGILWRGFTTHERVVTASLVIVALGASALALVQQRWWSVAAGAQISLAVAVTATLGGARIGRGARVAWIVAVAAMALPGPWFLILERMRVEKIADVQRGEAMQLLHRNLAGVALATAQERDVVLLAFPNTSVATGYYGGVRTVGTLYWENKYGLRAAAQALTAAEDGVAERIVRERGVTHVAVVTPGDFTAEYAEALGLPDEAVKRSLARRALEGRNVPVWLRAIPFQVPPQFDRLGVRVAVYAVDWDIAPAESRWALAMARLVAGDEIGGRVALREAAEAGRWEAALVLAWRMATVGEMEMRDGGAAVEWAEAAIARLPEAAAHRRVLAAAYAAAGRWADAQATAMFALDQARDAGDQRLAAEIEVEFARYRKRRSN